LRGNPRDGSPGATRTRPPVALFLPKGIWGTLVDKLPGGSSAEVKP
jgi:hypothetical protein